MKYESTILKRLIDTYGVVGNPRYISEIIKEFIVRGKECFPNLFTYQADWLAHIDEFGLKPTYTVSYTGQSIYAPNTLERPVKSAILTGQTLVNILPSVNDDRFLIKNSTTLERLEDGFLRINAPHKGRWEIMTNTIPIKPSTKYLLITEVKNNTVDGVITLANVSGFTTNNLTKVSVGFNGVLKQIITTKDVLSEYIFQGWLDSGSSGFVDIRNALIEYQDGMENWNIPYFEGMQSVKMPVLTTTGKNLLNPTLVERSYPSVATGENVPFNKNVSSTGAHTAINMFNCEYGKTYTVSVISGNADRKNVYEIDKNNKVLARASGKSTYTVSNPNTRYLYWYLGQDSTNIIPLDGVQIEEGTVATTYEPHKSNILTVNEPVELGSVGEVKDELNLLTQQLTQRTETRPYQEGDELNSEFVTDTTNTRYKLAQEVVKTVGLTILDQNGQNVEQLMAFNGGTHFNTTSSEGSPLPSVSVSVETDLEEILMMCSLEGNTL